MSLVIPHPEPLHRIYATAGDNGIFAEPQLGSWSFYVDAALNATTGLIGSPCLGRSGCSGSCGASSTSNRQWLGALRRFIALHRLAAWLVRWRTDAGPQVACANHRWSNLMCRDGPNCRFRVARQYGFRTSAWSIRLGSQVVTSSCATCGLFSALVSASPRAGQSIQ